jgi:carboxyl-terminal processing protease
VAKGVVNKAITGYIEKHRKELQHKYRKFEVFNEKFEIDENFLAELRALADKENISFDEGQYLTSLPLIKTQLKALIARDLWDMNEYYQVMNVTNSSVQQALKVLNENIYGKLIP